MTMAFTTQQQGADAAARVQAAAAEAQAAAAQAQSQAIDEAVRTAQQAAEQAAARGATITRDAQGRVLVSGSPTALYRAAVNRRDVLNEQLHELRGQREELAREIRTVASEGADKAGLEKRLTDLDGRISALEANLSEANLAVASAAGVPGVVMREPEPPETGPPEEAIITFSVFLGISTVILAVSWARRLWKRAGMVIAPVPQVLADRIGRIEQAVDAIAVEVERQGEGQRFLTRVLSESPRAVGPGAAQPVGVEERQREKA